MKNPKWTAESWLKFLLNLIKTVTGNAVTISLKNGKMGRVPSVSLPAWITCPKCGCWVTCYAHRYEKFRPSVIRSYARNYRILNENPKEYWRQVRKAIQMNRFFRFHVSGDIPIYEYLEEMVKSAIENPHCTILCFTKRYGFVNHWIDVNGDLPVNLKIIFSGWRDLKMENPHRLPEAHVQFKDGYCEAREDAFECFGCCEECYVAGCGCWQLKKNQQIVLKEH